MMAKSIMCDTLTITPKSGNGAYGPVYGVEYTVNAYVEAGYKRVVNQTGQEVVASLFAICAADFAGHVGDKVAFEGRNYEIVDVQPFREGRRVHHSEVYLQSIAG